MNSSIIPIREHAGKQVASLRDLHEFLEVNERFTDWAARMFEYGFTENQDYAEVYPDSRNNPQGGRPRRDWAITLDMGKEISMIQRTAKGKQARQYFIEVEKQSKALALPRTYAEALRELADTAERAELLEIEAKANAPKVLFADSVASSHTTILVGDLAKILKGNGVDVGANRLFDWLRRDGFLIRRKGTDWNMPTQKSMELGLFEVKETAVNHSDGHITVNKTPKVTGKGQTYFINKYLKEAQ